MPRAPLYGSCNAILLCVHTGACDRAAATHTAAHGFMLTEADRVRGARAEAREWSCNTTIR